MTHFQSAKKKFFIATKRFNGYKVLTTAMYEDGTMPVDESSWHWDDIDFDYDEQNDCYLIPCGWWEYRHYGECLNYAVDDKVTHWMPIPKPPSE